MVEDGFEPRRLFLDVIAAHQPRNLLVHLRCDSSSNHFVKIGVWYFNTLTELWLNFRRHPFQTETIKPGAFADVARQYVEIKPSLLKFNV